MLVDRKSFSPSDFSVIMRYFNNVVVKLIVICLFIILFNSFHISPVHAARYDIAYYWDTNLGNVLDYKDKLESVFPPEMSRKLIIVGRGNQYGVIYNQNGSALQSAKLFVRQNVLLSQAGLHEAYALKDQGYYRLYDISYGVGPHLSALKKRYAEVYKTLGKEVGKDLCIEQIDDDSYALLYLRRGDIRSTLKVARKHARLLRRLHIKTAVFPEDNNTVVFGESSLLNTDETDTADNSETNNQVTQQSEKPTTGNVPIPEIKRSPDKRKHYIVKGRLLRMPHIDGISKAEFDSIIEQFIEQQRIKGKLARDETTGWMVYDLVHNRTLANINADRVFQAASMIKPFIALAFFHEVKKGKLRYTRRARRIMEAMIQRSSNTAADWIMRRVGGPARCEQILKTYYPYIFKHTEIREYIPPNGRTYRNTAIPADYIRFLYELWRNRLPYTAEMRRLMALPGRDRLYDGTPIPQGTLVYDKTGTTAHLCGDMGILVLRSKEGRPYPYAVVGVIERRSRPSDYGTWMISRGNIIRDVSTLVYNHLKKQHNLK